MEQWQKAAMVYPVKGKHKRQLAYKAHASCDLYGHTLNVEMTARSAHDNAAWDDLYVGLYSIP